MRKENKEIGNTFKNEVQGKKDSSKKKILAGVISVAIAASIGGACYIKGEENKKTAQETAFDDVEVVFNEEYSDGAIALTKEGGTVDTKDLISVTKDGEEDTDTTIDSVDVAEIDTTAEGDYVVTYTLSTKDKLGNNATKTFEKTFSVVSTDTTAPVIKLKEDTVTLTVGDKFTAKDNVKSVKDEFDGEIKDYTVDDSKVNTSKKGTYKVTVTATDSANNKAEKEFTVKVKEAKTTASNDSKKSSTASSSSKTNTTTSKKNNTTASSNSNKTTSSSSSKSNSSTASNKNNSSSSSSSSSNNSSSSSNTSTPTQPTCRTVHHDATGHYETVVTGQTWVQDSAAWDETVATGSVVVCNGCGQEFGTYNEWVAHDESFMFQGNDDHGSYHTNATYSTVHHDATGHYENTTSQQWVQDSAAWDETVCS